MTKELKRKENGQFPKGKSGNPLGRPKGSKNAITLLKQSLELELREQAGPDMGAVLDKAVELALEGHPGMIKLLIELHMSKGTNDEVKGGEKVAIQINSAPAAPQPEIKATSAEGEANYVVIEPTPTEDNPNE